MKHSFLLLMTILLLGCQGSTTKNVLTKNAYLNLMDSTEVSSSLVFWGSDTAFSANPELMLLLDTLYQHVRADSVDTHAKTEDAWMAQYHSKLVRYFDTHFSDEIGLSNYEKVDSVLNEGARLIELDDDWSTMGSIVKLDTEHIVEVCREYNLFAQLLKRCKTTEGKDMLYSERKSYEEMSHNMLTVAHNLTSLCYWRGSIVSPMRCGQTLEVTKSHNAFYRNLLNILDGQYHGEKVGTSPKQKLINVCNITIKGITSDFLENISCGEEDKALLNEYLVDAKTGTKDLEPSMTKWLHIVSKLDKELATDGSRHNIEQCASSMLMQWSDIMKEIDAEQ